MNQKDFNIKNIGIYDYDKRISRTLILIKKELSQENIDLIEQYHNVMITESLSKAVQHKHLQTLLNLSRFLEKNWKDTTKSDIERIISKVVQKYSPDGQETNTTHDHKKVLKIFFRWLKLGSRDFKDVGNPEETKWIRLRPVSSNIVREQLLTDEDLTKILRACINPRDKAFFDVHYEAGTRPCEILSLRVKHVKFDNYGAVIHVDGKTGPRPIRLVRSVPNLAKWIDEHPFNDDPEAPLWIILERPKYGDPMTYHTANAMLKRAIKRTELKKHVNLKLFRHSEATNSAKFLNEAQMRIRHGWTPSSKMPENYVHLVNADVDEAYLKHLGIKPKEEEKVNVPKICHICKMSNSPESELCNKCGRPLDLQKALELEEKANQQNFMTNKIAGKVLVQMLMTGEIPKLPKDEINSIIKSLNL